MQVPRSGIMFKRAFYRSELHSEAYTANRKTCSHNVAIVYLEDPPLRRGQKEPGDPVKVVYYGSVHKFFKMCIGDKTFRLAFVTTYHPSPKKNTFGVDYINLKKPFFSGHIVQVVCIDRKVIFAPGHPTAVLAVPEPHVRLPWKTWIFFLLRVEKYFTSQEFKKHPQSFVIFSSKGLAGSWKLMSWLLRFTLNSPSSIAMSKVETRSTLIFHRKKWGEKNFFSRISLVYTSFQGQKKVIFSFWRCFDLVWTLFFLPGFVFFLIFLFFLFR